MPENKLIYPATPDYVPDSITQVSASFKKGVSGVMMSIILFLLVYVLMFALSIGLIITCVYGGIKLIAAVPNIFMIFVGLGIVGLGIMVFIFLVKFLFAVSKYDDSGSIQLNKEEQPELFEFIRRLTEDVQTPFPKKILLSPDVNAAVFYNSSFWSMFLPIRKNLQIGLGLVNSLNVSEFKAVLAHEFGHFSQRSMKLGSFVYNVNKIIHNMLFHNTGYVSLLGGFASLDGTFAFFARITAAIARAIQWVLGQMYAVVNKSYMQLSREMEFHADAVAASVSGSQSLVTALRRVELGMAGYNVALKKCEDLLRQNKVSNNVYHNHRTAMKELAAEYKLPLENDIPVVTEKVAAENNVSRVNFKDQWASHPSMEDRVDQLDKLAVVADVVKEPAWILFRDGAALQVQLTNKMYEQAIKDKEIQLVENAEFEQSLGADISKSTLPAAYNGFYDNRQFPIITPDEITTSVNGPDQEFESIFTVENAALFKRFGHDGNDIEVLKAISDKRIRTKTFDFDGEKYKRKDAAALIEKLEAERKRQKEELDRLDKTAMEFFMSKALKQGPGELDRLKQSYKLYFDNRVKAEEFSNDTDRLFESLAPIFRGETMPVETINVMMDDLKSDHEVKLKKNLQLWLDAGAFEHDLASKQKAQEFIHTRHSYFSDGGFIDRQLIMLNEVSNEAWNSVNIFLFGQFKSILESQLLLIGKN